MKRLIPFLLLFPSIALAQTVLTPSSYAARPGDPITLSITRDGKPAAWDDAQITWSMVRIAGTQENSDRAPRENENAGAGAIRIQHTGAAIVGVDFKPVVITPDAKSIESLTRGRTDIKAPEAGTKVQSIQSVKTIIRIGDTDPGQSANVTSKSGQQTELRPTFDPTGIGIGSDIPVVVYAGDGKVPGARLTATHVATGEKQEFTANAGAIGSFRLSRAGIWRIEFQHLAAAKNPKEGEPAWVMYTATLTFEAPQRDAAKEGAK